jgi:hypothetical protein
MHEKKDPRFANTYESLPYPLDDLDFGGILEIMGILDQGTVPVEKDGSIHLSLE